MNYNQIYAIKQKNKQRVLKCKNIPNVPGIYILKRYKPVVYVGQSLHCLDRIAEHLSGYQAIDLSLKKHGFSNENYGGYDIYFEPHDKSELDEFEQKYIKAYQEQGVELRNLTAGGQGQGKIKINEFRPAKTYRDGLKQGYENARKDVAKLFEKNLEFNVRKENKITEKAKNKFESFLKGE